jgi:carbamoylphosphate synthase small subunit
LYSAIYGEDGYPFHDLAEKVVPVTHPEEMTEFDSALVIWGGADISPDFYSHEMSRRCAPYAGRRDQVEWQLLQEAIEMEIPIIGICRGAQMVCAAAGGFLIQDVEGHAGYDHHVVTQEGLILKVNSLHHQMMVPAPQNPGDPAVEYELVAWAIKNQGEPYIYRDDRIFKPEKYGFEHWKEPEFLYFPKIDAYAVQWHPEMMFPEAEATKYIINYFNEKQKMIRAAKKHNKEPAEET